MIKLFIISAFFVCCACLRSAEHLPVDRFLDIIALRPAIEQSQGIRYFGVYSLLTRSDYTSSFGKWYKEKTGNDIIDAGHVILKIDVPFVSDSPEYIILEPMVALGSGKRRFRFPSRGVSRYFLNFSLQDAGLATPINQWDSIIGIADLTQRELSQIHLKYAISERDVENYFSPLRALIVAEPK